MKAIRVEQYGSPEVLQLKDVPDLVPGNGQVVVRAHAVGVNPVDTYLRAGNYGVLNPPLPYTPGSDAAGIIEAVGAGVPASLQPGNRVYVYGSQTGTYAEQILCDAAQVYPLPDSISFEQGAALGVPYGTAFRALFQRGGGKAGESLLVHGATGAVGMAAVQYAVAAGLTVIGTGGTERGRDAVKDFGAALVLDHHDPHYLDAIVDFTGGAGVNLILEMLANANLGKDLTILAKNGRVVVIGSRGPVEVNPRETMGREADIRGMTLMAATEADKKQIHAAIHAGFSNGMLNPIVGKSFPLDQAAEAHKAVMESGAFGKIVLVP